MSAKWDLHVAFSLRHLKIHQNQSSDPFASDLNPMNIYRETSTGRLTLINTLSCYVSNVTGENWSSHDNSTGEPLSWSLSIACRNFRLFTPQRPAGKWPRIVINIKSWRSNCYWLRSNVRNEIGKWIRWINLLGYSCIKD